MTSDLSRRTLMKGICSTAALSAALPAAAILPALLRTRQPNTRARTVQGCRRRGLTRPRSAPRSGEARSPTEAMRRVKQLGVNNVLMGGPKMPWQEADLQATVDKLKTGGLAVGNMMIAGFPNCIYGRAGADRDKEIEDFKSSVRAAGKVGLPVVEYNWYAHRAIEGYYLEEGRGGAGLTGFNINKVENLPTVPEEGVSFQRGTVEEHHLLSTGGHSHLRAIERAPGAAP